MNIPLKVFKSSQYLTSSTLSNHQTFAKHFMKLSTKNKNPVYNQPQNKRELLTWFFSLDLPNRIKAISIQNNWLIKMIFQMFTLYLSEPRIKYEPTKDYDEFHPKTATNLLGNYTEINNLPVEYYQTFYKPIRPPRMDSLQKELGLNVPETQEQAKTEKEIISNVRILTIDSLNDTLTLSIDLLNNEKAFEELFDKLSESKCFKSPLNSLFDSNHNYHNFSLPDWGLKRTDFSLGQLLVLFFEQSISINYKYYLMNKQVLYSSPIDNKIKELLDNNAKIETYLNEECKSSADDSKFFNSLNVTLMNYELKQDVNISDLLKESRDISVKVITEYQGSKSYNTYKTFHSSTIESKLQNLFVSGKKPQFVDLITFIRIDNLFQFENFIYHKIFQKLYDLYSKKNAAELIEEICNNNNDKKTTGKKKKHKKKGGNKGIAEEKEKDNHEENTEIKEKDEKNNDDNHQPEDKENNKEETAEVTITNEKDSNNKKKKKEFFLFPTREKKTQNNKDNKTAKQNDKDKKTINDISNDTTPINSTHNNNKEKESLKEESNCEINLSLPNNIVHSITTKANNTTIIDESSTSSLSYIPENKITISITNPVFNNYYTIDNNPLQYPQQSIPQIQYQHQFHQPILPIRLPYYPTQQIYMNPYTQQQPFSDPYFNLITKLHKEIEYNASNVSNHLSLLKSYKLNYINKISSVIESSLKNYYDIELLSYGSFATGLGIESSDIDIVIKFKAKDNVKGIENQQTTKIEQVINILAKEFNKTVGLFDYVKPIYTASVPVLKVQCDMAKDIDKDTLQIIKQQYFFDMNEIEKVKVDLTFFEVPYLVSSNAITIPSQLVVEFVMNSLIRFPEIKPILNVMKRYLQIEKLHLNFNGGISSFSLFLLLFAFLKIYQQKNQDNHFNVLGLKTPLLGKVFIEFLEYYSSFNFQLFCIDVNSQNPFIPLDSINENGILILDPFTSLNVAKSSFRLEEIKAAFKKAHYITLKHFYSFKYNEQQPMIILSELFSLKL